MDVFEDSDEGNFECKEENVVCGEASELEMQQTRHDDMLGRTPAREARKLNDLSLHEILTRIRNLQKPPPPRDFKYFKEICGLPAVGTNAHKLQSPKHVSVTNLQSLFGLGRGRSGFRFVDCKDSQTRGLIHKLWPQVYGKPNLPVNKLISKEFCLGIVAQVRMGMQMDWARLLKRQMQTSVASIQRHCGNTKTSAIAS